MHKHISLTRLLPRLLGAVVLAAVVVCTSCKKNNEAPALSLIVEDDSVEVVDQGVIYGLACEGCTDSVVWLLPLDASDPVPYDVITATKKHKILGRIRTGDGLIVVLNAADSTVADMVVDERQLKGTWCFTAMPSLKGAANMTAKEQKEAIAALPDSILAQFYRPLEYGFSLKRNNALSTVSVRMQVEMNAEDNPFEYKEGDRYTAWHFVDEHLVLSRQTVRYLVEMPDSDEVNAPQEPVTRIETTTINDTTTIVYLSDDSLAIQFKNRLQGYYRKQ